MSPFQSILVPLDGSRRATQSLACASWLAARLGAQLHLLSATPTERSTREELSRLRVPEEHWPRIVLHQAVEPPEEAILDAIARHRVDLLVMTALGEGSEEPEGPEGAKTLGHVTRAVAERSAVPILLLPPGYREKLPWERFLVPISGEREGSDALALAVRLANALDLRVHVVHVDAPDHHDEGLEAEARYPDAPHHEYPRQLEEMVARALLHVSGEECRCIEDVSLAEGDVASEVLDLAKRKRASVLVAGWHGPLDVGRAAILKRLVAELTVPVLLVKRSREMRFRLVAGEELG